MICRNPVVETGRYVLKRGEATIQGVTYSVEEENPDQTVSIFPWPYDLWRLGEGQHSGRRGKAPELNHGTELLSSSHPHLGGKPPTVCWKCRAHCPPREQQGNGMDRGTALAGGTNPQGKLGTNRWLSSLKVWSVLV